MSLTISELEAERAKILEEIENKAQTISGDATPSSKSPSLKSWLNAAEEVMPASKAPHNANSKRADKQMRTPQNAKSNYQSQVLKTPKNKANKASFFGVLIMLTLLLTLLGVIYIAYSSIHKELQNVLLAHEQSIEKIQSIQTDMNALQKAIATGGKVELFVALEDKIFALESQVVALKNQVDLLATSDSPSLKEENTLPENTHVTTANKATQEATQVADSPLVTQATLEQSLQRYTEKLEAQIDQKFEKILNYISQNNRGGEKKEENRNLSLTSDSDRKLNIETNVSDVKKPVIEQPLVQLIKPVEAPKEPKQPDLQATKPPVAHYSADVKWLMSEPPMHYTLQLASMLDQNSLQNMVIKKQLKQTRILPQTRNGVTNYVLIMGSFSDRKLATALAKQLKSESGISPWIRKIKDLSARIQ